MKEDIKPPKGNSTEVASESLTEDSISDEAIDFEDNSFLEKNKHSGKSKKDAKDSADDEEEDDADEYEQKFIDEHKPDEKKESVDPEELMDTIIREIAEQPFEVAMSNLEITREQVISAAEGVFSKKGYFEHEFALPFTGSVTMRSKTVNDYVDYTEYVRRLLLDPISQKEFDTYTQLRNMTYAVVELDGDDLSELPIEERFDILRNTSEVKITAIINTTRSFWRVAHLLLHPGLLDFLAQTPEE
jgi:hypothetical protein